MALSVKQQVFVEAYLRCWNATEAARQAGYSEKTAKQQGSRLLTKVDVQAAVKVRIAELTMSADEVLTRLSEHGRGDIGEFMGLEPGEIAAHPQTRLIKTYERTVTTGRNEFREEKVKLELYSAQAALLHLWKHHQLAQGKPTDSVDVLDAKERIAQLLARQSGRSEPGEAAGGTE